MVNVPGTSAPATSTSFATPASNSQNIQNFIPGQFYQGGATSNPNGWLLGSPSSGLPNMYQSGMGNGLPPPASLPPATGAGPPPVTPDRGTEPIHPSGPANPNSPGATKPEAGINNRLDETNGLTARLSGLATKLANPPNLAGQGSNQELKSLMPSNPFSSTTGTGTTAPAPSGVMPMMPPSGGTQPTGLFPLNPAAGGGTQPTGLFPLNPNGGTGPGASGGGPGFGGGMGAAGAPFANGWGGGEPGQGLGGQPPNTGWGNFDSSTNALGNFGQGLGLGNVVGALKGSMPFGG